MKRSLFYRSLSGGMSRHYKRVSAGEDAGFTIVETMIVLLVTSALFASAAALINGRQNATYFSQSIRDVQTQMQRVISDVGSGYYPNDGSIKCETGGPGGGVSLTSGVAEQGTNKGCIFLGKIMQFGVTPSTDPEVFNEYTVVGLSGAGSVAGRNLAEAKARVVARAAGEPASVPNDSFEQRKLLYGLTVSKMYYDGVATNNIRAFGFSSRLNSLADDDPSQQLDLVAIPSNPAPVDTANGVRQINGSLINAAGFPAAVVNPSKGIQICFNSGSTDQSGLITLGGSNRQGSVQLKIYEGRNCV
ncbi:MAG TPA: hypothetical protein VF575_05595 [Candidatus Saccharimonadales bacterium]